MRPCRFLPCTQIGDRKRVVRILLQIRRCIQHDQRQNHLLEGDHIHGDPLFVEMRRRIDVGTVLADELVERCAEAVFLDGVRALRLRIGCGCHFGLAEAGPNRGSRIEAVREINETL